MADRLKTGDNVVVDKRYVHKKYDAQVHWIGRGWAQIKVNKKIIPIKADRLTLK